MTRARTGRFRRSDRLLRSGEFQRVARRGHRVATRHFVLLLARDEGRMEGQRRRLGITTSRKVGNAVVRNRVKRRVREWFRRSRSSIAAGSELLVIARPAATDLATREVGAVLDEMLHTTRRGNA
ncbi:MAG: ribonuclease P protein component [Myxococcota bacterium]